MPEKQLILGPPGTGKTTKAINIMRDLLADGVEPEKIAFVSFTKKAADEARDRCVAQLSLPADRFPHVRTLHSLAFRECGLSRSDVMNNHDYDEISERLGIRISDGNTDSMDADNLVGFHLGQAKITCRSYEDHYMKVAGSMLDRRFHFGGANRGCSKEDFVKAGKYLEDYKQHRGVVDFNDMLEEGRRCMPIDVDYVIIDEAQDLSALQWRFAAHIFQDAKKVWVAGDDDQAIFTWAGADLHTFRNMQADREVLDQSYRLPATIHEFAMRLADKITDRYEKEFNPRDELGELHYVAGLQDCPLDNDESWFLLTRTRGQQFELVKWLRRHGYAFTQNGKDSIKKAHLKLADTYTKLQRGESVPVSAAITLYESLRNDQYDKKGKDRLLGNNFENRVSMTDLIQFYGFTETDALWHEILTIDADDSEYYRRVKDRGGMTALTDEPMIQLNTIHGVKGGEADNVYFSSSMGRKPYRFYKAGFTRDDEARIFYVAATRAKKRLYVKTALKQHFPIPFWG